MKILTIENATKQFGGVNAVVDVSFSVEKGEIVGLIGPNGSGKTTLINLISGTLNLTSGDIRYNKLSLKGIPTFQRARMGIARTFQIVKPLRNLTVEDNIMTAALFGTSKLNTFQEIFASLSTKPSKGAYRDIDNILQRTKLTSQKKRFARNLTLSDQKRLEVGRALAMDPQLLLLDEVMAGLNFTEINQMMELISTLNSEGVTILMVEHIMKVVMGISHRIVVLDQGELIADSTPEQVVRDPRVIAAYLGSRYTERNSCGVIDEPVRS